MCGIAGLLGAEPGSFGERVRPAIAHRGPDDAGIWQNATTCLVQTRLAILDLSTSGHQPMASPCGRWQLVFNGEIYNHASLRQRLEAEGERFQGSGDTEVLLRWMARRGRSGLADLRGMFAFCLVDTRDGSALLARDPHGIKPLYIWQGPSGELAFASELRALLASDRIPRRPDPEAIAAFLASGSVPEPATLVAGVKRLQAGHWLQWRDGTSRIKPWWPLPESLLGGEHQEGADQRPRINDRTEAIELTRSALRDSVAAHMVSDVPVGLFLSAGLDSAALLALAPPGLHTFTIGFADPGSEGFDESEPAAKIAALFGAEHTALTLRADQARRWLPDFLSSQDQPSIDGFNTWCVARLASERGLKVALSGLGGDELFGGYPSFRSVPRLHRWRRRLGPLGPVAATVLSRSPGGREQKRQRLAELLRGAPSLQAAHRCLRGQFTTPEVAALMAHWNLPAGPGLTVPGLSEAPPDGLDSAEAVAWLESSRYLRNQLLPDSDVMAMATALELRLPYVDATLERQLATIAPSLRLAHGKALLQSSMPELPLWFTNRPKQGFRFPFQLWLDDPQSPLALRVPSTPAGLDLRPWYRRWNLMVLESWLRHHLAIVLPHP
jgi:asparagine synthase (glutamine-hydrolysing)